MTSPIAEIKERLDIADFIRSYITLTPAGKNFKAACPFHKEKTPSFMVSPERQTWHCFGACAEGGDIFKFLMKYENLEFYEALKVLAEKAGVELKRISPADQKQFGILYDINAAAKEFFIRQLAERTNEEVLNYLKNRGLKKETIEEFEIGFSPNSFDVLSRYLINLGYDIKDAERAGLIFKTEKGSYIDRFRGRIMFPIYNHFGKVIGFTGRIFQFQEVRPPEVDSQYLGGRTSQILAKYINSPETPIFNKSRILYGFHKTKKEILGQKSAILVEGQMDFLMAYQDGAKNIIATSGTALTPDHLKTLRRIADRLIFLFDNDEAGLKAAERSIDLADNFDFNVGLVVLKDYKDPAEAVQKKPGFLAEALKGAISAMRFYFQRYLEEGEKRKEENDLADFKKNLRIVLGKIKMLASPVERAHWVKELSLKTKIEEKTLAEEMEQLRNEKLVMSNEKKELNTKYSILNTLTRRELIAQRLMSLILAKEDLAPQLKDSLEYLPVDYQKIYEKLSTKGGLDQRLGDLMNLISLRSTFETQNLDDEKITREFNDLLKHLKLEHYKEKKRELAKEIKEAEKAGDEKKLSEILQEFDRLSKLMHNV